MEWLEIIRIQAIDGDGADTLERLRAVIRELTRNGRRVDIRLYQHPRLPMEFTLLLRHPARAASSRGSDVGLQLAWALKPYGYVDHTIWQETVNSEAGEFK